MATVHRVGQTEVVFPDSYEVEIPGAVRSRGKRARGGKPPRGPQQLRSAADDSADDPLVRALAEQGVTVKERVPLRATSAAVAAAAKRGARGPSESTVAIRADVAADEQAVVLLEQDGVYAFRFGKEVVTPATARRGARATRCVEFMLDLRVPGAGSAKLRKRGLRIGFLWNRVKVYVLRFAAKAAVKHTMKALEANVSRGLVHLIGDDLAKWREFNGVKSPPAGRPVRVLLFIHGTFSSTWGSFGALTQTKPGRDFLAAARDRYDAVVGFDHSTLSVDPRENAKDLLQRLAALPWSQPPEIDVIAYSRGGLVYRSLVEDVLPGAKFKGTFRRAAFVAVPNGGTALAEGKNWQTLLDLYANVAVGTIKLVRLVAPPTSAAATTILSELISGAASLVKFMALNAANEGAVPGLAAMRPQGDFILALNQAQPGQPTVGACEYYVVSSEFDALASNAEKLSQLPRKFLALLVDRVVDRLLASASDLVVNTESMTAIDKAAGNFVRDQFAFGKTASVYHTNYFLQADVSRSMSKWFTPPDVVKAPKSPGSAMPSPRQQGGSKLYVGNLSYTATGAELEELFNDYGKVSSAQIIEDRDTGRSKGFGFVEMGSDEEAQAAIEALNGKETDGRALVVNEAKPREKSAEKPGGAGWGMEGGGTGGGGVDQNLGFTRVPGVNIGGGGGKRGGGGIPAFDKGDQAQRTARDSRKSESKPKPKPPAAPEEKILCNFHAEMDAKPIVNHLTTLEVIISRETIESTPGTVAAGAGGLLESGVPLFVGVECKAGLEYAGEAGKDCVKVNPPEPNEPQTIQFDLRAIKEGPGEVLVSAKQHDVRLIKLTLRPQVVSRAARSAERLASDGTLAPFPKHWLRIRENVKERKFTYEMTSPSLKIQKTYELSPFKGSRQKFVDELYKEIQAFWTEHEAKGAEAQAKYFTEALRARGHKLFEQLIPPDLQQVLWDNRARIDSIWVISEEPFIPWEMVLVHDPGKKLSPDDGALFLAQMGLVRWLNNVEGWVPSQVRIRKDRAFYVIPNYPEGSDYELSETQTEGAFLKKTFGGATAVTPQPNEVLALLNKRGAFDLFHFAGHGFANSKDITNSELLLEGTVNKKGEWVPSHINASDVEAHARLEDAEGNRPMVVINACKTGRQGYELTGIGGMAKAFLGGEKGGVAGAAVFVGTLWSVGDNTARTFTEQFYTALLAGKTVAQASIAAREAARTAKDNVLDQSTWLAYVVYGHPDAKLVK
jgi:hypothetical protein